MWACVLLSFQTFRRVLDSEMKATHREGESIAEKRTRREKEAITDDQWRGFASCGQKACWETKQLKVWFTQFIFISENYSG